MSRHTTEPHACEQCGKPFHPKKQDVKNGYGRFCSRHCHHVHKTRPAAERFWKFVNKSGPIPVDHSLGNCWVWTGGLFYGGYGIFGPGKGKTVSAHRWSYMNNMGPIPNGLAVCHKCDNPACIRPDHLFLGTAKDNVQDMHAKGRHSKGESHWYHKLTIPKVLDIREASRCGESDAKIAKRHGVSRRAIYSVLSGQTWKHVS